MLLSNRTRRQELYESFIGEASKLYGDALVSNSPDNVEISKFIGLYVMLSRMRILSSRNVVDDAEKIIDVIAKTYSDPPKTWREVHGKGFHELDILRHFSETCRDDLKGRGSI